MWPLATWSKKTKFLITFAILGIIGLVFVPFSLGLFYKNVDVFNIPNIIAFASRIGWMVILTTLLISTILSILFKIQNKSIKKIWLIAGIILIFTFIIMFIILMSGAASIYNLTHKNSPQFSASSID